MMTMGQLRTFVENNQLIEDSTPIMQEGPNHDYIPIYGFQPTQAAQYEGRPIYTEYGGPGTLNEGEDVAPIILAI